MQPISNAYLQTAQPTGLMANTVLPSATTIQSIPQTGLIGAEQALRQGLLSATGAINAGYSGAANNLNQYQQSMDSRNLSLDTSVGSDVAGAINQGVAAFDTYSKSGANADKLYNDLTGVNGPQAQQAAQAAYQSSPALKYQIDQGQRAIERSSAAKGGLLSGTVLKELQANAQGLASQDYFKNLGAIGETANRGITAASGVAGLKGQEAGIAGSLRSTGLQAQAQYEIQKEQTRADIANKLSGLSESHGLNIANLNTGYSQTVADARSTAGYALGQNATQAATNISNLLNSQGVGVSDMISKDISSVTDFLYQSGMQDKVDAQNLAALIANINGGQATNVMQGNQAIGAATAAGQLGIGNAVNNAIDQSIKAGLIGIVPKQTVQ